MITVFFIGIIIIVIYLTSKLRKAREGSIISNVNNKEILTFHFYCHRFELICIDSLMNI